MAILARYEGTAVDNAGNVLDSPTIEVRNESGGAPAVLYSDRGGSNQIANPFTGNPDGTFFFHVVGGAYRIIATSSGRRRVLRYVGIGTAKEFDLSEGAAAAGNAGLFLIESQTASNSSALSFTITSAMTDVFRAFELRISGLRPATDGDDLFLRIGTGGGPTYQSGATDYAWQLNTGTMSPAITGTADSSDSEITIAQALGNATAESLDGVIFFSNPSSATRYKMFGWQTAHLSPQPESTTSFGSGRYITATTAITGVQLLMSTGNIAEGLVSLYGYAE